MTNLSLKPSFLLVARAACGLACVLSLAATPARVVAEELPAARAVLVEAERDAGKVAPGEPAIARFRVENRGTTPLTITAGNPRPFVAGVRSDVAGSPVAPGDAATVTVTLDTGSLAGEGKVHVPLATSDPAAPTLTVTLVVQVEPALLADPGYARYNVVQKERDGTIAQTVWSADGATFRVVAVESPNDQLRVSFREAAPVERRADAGSQWRVESVLATDAAVGALGGDIVVVTDHPRQKRLRIPLSGFVRPVLAVTPPVAELGEVDGSKPFRFTLDVKTFATEEIALERAECDLPGATVEIIPVTAGRAYRVRVALPAVSSQPRMEIVSNESTSDYTNLMDPTFGSSTSKRIPPSEVGRGSPTRATRTKLDTCRTVIFSRQSVTNTSVVPVPAFDGPTAKTSR